MLATASVFDVLAADDTERRTASRRCLALAHTRVDHHLGRFLRGAVTIEEFEARLAAVQDEMAAYVATAAEETGHDHPEHIATALVDHYRNTRRWQPREALIKEAPGKEHMPGVSDKRNRQYEHIKEQLEDSGKDEERAKEEAARTVNKQRAEHGETKEGRDKQGAPLGEPQRRVMGPPDPDSATLTEGDAFDQGFGGTFGTCPECGGQIEDNPDPKRTYYPDSFPPYACRNCRKTYTPLELEMVHNGTYPLRSTHGFTARVAADPSEQRDTSPGKVTCPECGGSGKTANDSECPKCHGIGRVENFGDSVLDHVAAYDEPDTDIKNKFEVKSEGSGDKKKVYVVEKGTEDRHVAEFDDEKSARDAIKEWTEHRNKFAADSAAPRCPKCGSGSTGLRDSGGGQGEISAECSACHHIWRPPDVDMTKTAEEGNTGLGGPSPKMDKRKWTPRDVPKLKYDEADGPHPTRHKDPLEVQRAKNGDELEEIGESVTERQDLPASDDNSGFSTKQAPSAPSSGGTWSGSGGQADPVTS